MPHSPNRIGKLFHTPLRLLGLGEGVQSRAQRVSPGAPPGIDHLQSIKTPPEDDAIAISAIYLSEDNHEQIHYKNIDELIESSAPDWATTKWIDIQGIHPYVISRLQDHYGFHPLAAEDALHVPQRPKVEDYDDALFIILKMLRTDDKKLINEHISFFFRGDTLITIQEVKGDIWDNVRLRMKKKVSRVRNYGTPYLLYMLIDAIVDHIFPLLDRYFEVLDKLEEEIIEKPQEDAQIRIHAIKRELVYLRQALWPMRDVVSSLRKDDYDLLPPEVETYFRDVNDHITQANDAIETYRETANGLQDLLIAASGNKMNEVMKGLTIMASLFLPITFLAGVYGMNMAIIPELNWPYAYPTFWGICLASTGSLLYYFKRKGWIGK